MGASCTWNRNVLSTEVAEALAAVQAIPFAQDMGFHRVRLEGDSMVVISKLKAQKGWKLSGSPFTKGGISLKAIHAVGGGGPSDDYGPSGGGGDRA
ncbi:hypothetical protein Gogos_000382 [Gossypium gossypioides]|uniref:RNase H type-1 domain-containing protein n=1 Tax=Gossypium gossypioides TaxID=34282 RepID=A0A7J9CST7_GOSGO|nr:hypothetical protein [Gossypium gossypioides]